MIDISGEFLKNKGKTQKISFSQLLNNSISQVNELLLKSEEQGNMLALGQVDNLHQVVIASQKAELALQYTMQIRNKVLDAYHEIMRMSI